MKKILAILLALAMVLAMTACGGSKTSQAPAEPPKEAEKEAGNTFELFDDPWFTATKGTVARREIQHHESKNSAFDGALNESYDEVYAYDADGNELYVRGIGTDGEKYENTFEYDAEGNRIFWTARNEEDGEYFISENTYENGLLVRNTEKNSESEIVILYEYNGKGWCNKETFTSSDGWGNYVTEFEYNENGDIIHEYCDRGEDGSYECVYTYDGDLLMKYVYDGIFTEGMKSHAETIYEYNEKDQCVKTVEKYDDHESVSVTEYDDNNNRISEKYTSPDSTYEYKYEYDADGKVTRMTAQYADGESCEELYEYDSEGRVVRDEYTSKMNGEFSYSNLITYAYE